MIANRTLMFATAAAVAVALGWAAAPAHAVTNLLANPGFENGAGGGSLAGWGAFGNAFADGTPTPGISTRTGDGVGKMFGNFWGPGAFNVTGVYQQIPTTPGSTYQLHVYSRQNTGDDLTGGTADNWAVEKITFFNGGTELGSSAVEARIMDATFAKDTWVDNTTITATAPAGATAVGVYLMFLQPNVAGGAVFLDDASLTLVPEPASVGLIATTGIGLIAGRRRRAC